MSWRVAGRATVAALVCLAHVEAQAVKPAQVPLRLLDGMALSRNRGGAEAERADWESDATSIASHSRESAPSGSSGGTQGSALFGGRLAAFAGGFGYFVGAAALGVASYLVTDGNLGVSLSCDVVAFGAAPFILSAFTTQVTAAGLGESAIGEEGRSRAYWAGVRGVALSMGVVPAGAAVGYGIGSLFRTNQPNAPAAGAVAGGLAGGVAALVITWLYPAWQVAELSGGGVSARVTPTLLPTVDPEGRPKLSPGAALAMWF